MSSFQPSYPPPPPVQAPTQEKTPPVAWLVPLAGLLALVGAFTPWFKPTVTATINGRTVSDSVNNALYSWKDGKIGLLAPIVLVILGVTVIGLLRGRVSSRFGHSPSGPVFAAARAALIAGVVSLAAAAVAWFLLPHQYKFSVGSRTYDWDELTRTLQRSGGKNVEIGHGPQLGYWLTVAAGVLALVGGALMMALRDKNTAAPQPLAPPAPNGSPLPGYPPAGAAPQGAPYGAPQGSPYGAPQGSPYGAPQGSPYGTPQGSPYGAPQGAPQQAPPPSFDKPAQG